MTGIQVLLVAGTHGNEINAPWLFDKWNKNPDLINDCGLSVLKEIGNPSASKKNRRYIDRDLNRSFSFELLNKIDNSEYEIKRAKDLLAKYGSNGSSPCQIVIDFHSTTSSMGSSLVVYGRRSVDLALASLIQFRLGLPIYLHEGDKTQTGFLVEAWPCGLVVEIGPVSQGLLHERVIKQTLIALQACLAEIAKVKSREANYPQSLFVHRHLKSVECPRDFDKQLSGPISPNIQGKDWQPVNYRDPMFSLINGELREMLDDNISYPVYPVFINEAAYKEKNISMSLTNREVWNYRDKWGEDLYNLINRVN